MIMENSSNQRSLFNVTKSLLNMTKLHPVIPPHIDKRTFVNDLGNFFCDKIVRIHSASSQLLMMDFFTSNDIFLDSTDFQISPSEIFSHFKVLPVRDVEILVANLISKKSCLLDPIPTNI